MRLTEYLWPRLFDPNGIGEVGWLTWPPGRQEGFSGLFARTEDVAKLGQLYVQRGRWGDAQLLPDSYVELATSRQIDTPNQDNVDWRQGYGLQFCMSRYGYRGGRRLRAVLPSTNANTAARINQLIRRSTARELLAHHSQPRVRGGEVVQTRDGRFHLCDNVGGVGHRLGVASVMRISLARASVGSGTRSSRGRVQAGRPI
jgi:CubicO group peptidase (beta-lactamase class C family)